MGTPERECFKALERKSRGLRQANEVLREASALIQAEQEQLTVLTQRRKTVRALALRARIVDQEAAASVVLPWRGQARRISVKMVPVISVEKVKPMLNILFSASQSPIAVPAVRATATASQ